MNSNLLVQNWVKCYILIVIHGSLNDFVIKLSIKRLLGRAVTCLYFCFSLVSWEDIQDQFEAAAKAITDGLPNDLPMNGVEAFLRVLRVSETNQARLLARPDHLVDELTRALELEAVKRSSQNQA